MQVKVFHATGLRRKGLDRLEDQVNGWLKDNPKVEVVEIKQMTVGSFGPGNQLVISILYESAS